MKKIVLFFLIAAMLVTSCGASSDEPASQDSKTNEETATQTEAASSEAEQPADESASEDKTEPAASTDTTAEEPTAGDDCPTITLVTHDSFYLSEGTLEAFTEETCIEIDHLAGGDTGAMLSAAILTKDNPTADVMFGVDNTFLQRALDAELFQAYESPALENVADELELDAGSFRVTPIDYGDVCLNYWNDALSAGAPTTLDDLTKPEFKDQFVTQHPETSSPGFAFLLATIATFGEDGWQDYWRALKDNGVEITAGWEDAYYGPFVAGGGERAVVTSYASSPAAEVIYADPPVETAPTGVLEASCYRQIEFAGVIAGTEHPEAAQKLIDFMLSETFQSDIPLNMFVYPANETVALPQEFIDHASPIAEALMLDPQEIEANRETWTQQWVEIVLD